MVYENGTQKMLTWNRCANKFEYMRGDFCLNQSALRTATASNWKIAEHRVKAKGKVRRRGLLADEFLTI